MSDCSCHAGKICDLHVTEVMGNLNKEGLRSGIVGGYLGDANSEQSLPDLHGEIVNLYLRITYLEDGRKFNLDLIENLAKRLNEAEDKLKSIEAQFLQFIELRKIKGTG